MIATSAAAHEGLVAELRTLVGDSHVLDTAELMEPYCIDWTRRWSGAALAVVRNAAPFPRPPAGARRSFSIRIQGR